MHAKADRGHEKDNFFCHGYLFYNGHYFVLRFMDFFSHYEFFVMVALRKTIDFFLASKVLGSTHVRQSSVDSTYVARGQAMKTKSSPVLRAK